MTPVTQGEGYVKPAPCCKGKGKSVLWLIAHNTISVVAKVLYGNVYVSSFFVLFFKQNSKQNKFGKIVLKNNFG